MRNASPLLLLALMGACSDDSSAAAEVGNDTTTSDTAADTGSGADSSSGSGASDTGSAEDSGSGADATADTGSTACIGAGGDVNTALFLADGLAGPITEESCTLSSGATATCLSIPLKGAPADHSVGPFCPRTITDGAESGGIWIENGTVYDISGSFITGLATFYNDPAWQLYDAATGLVRVTDSQAACQAAARPDVDPAYNNYCVECLLEYVDGGITTTLLIPKRPVPRTAPSEIGMVPAVGLAFNGVAFDPPAPVNAILAAHTIAAFDDCGGHVNLLAGYHYHAATGCSTAYPSCDEHAPQIGYALDGYPIFAMTGADGVEATDLDSCRGHEDALYGYHYHAASPGENMFIGCFHGETAADSSTGGGGGGGPGPGGDPAACAPGQTARCCGDGLCDGPETPTTCAADCP
jgi:hypothetical protein